MRGVDIFNVVRQEASGAFKEVIPSAAPENIANLSSILFNDSYSHYLNEFVSNLINRISLTIVRNKSFNNPLAMFKKGSQPLGTDIQEIYTNPAEAEQYVLNENAASKLLTITNPDTKVAYYSRNRKDKYTKTVARDALEAAFVSWDAFEDYVSSISQSLYSGAYIDEFELIKLLIDGAYDNNKVVMETVDDPTTSEANAKAFIKKARALFAKMQFPSTSYNAYNKYISDDTPVKTWTDPERVVLITTADIIASVDVDVLAAAFNMGKADFMGRVVIVDKFDNADLYGVICDESWLQIYDNRFNMENFYNPSIMANNLYLHVWGTYALSPFANAVALVKAEPTPLATLTLQDKTGTVGTDVEVIVVAANKTSIIAKALSSDERIATVALDSTKKKVVVSPVAAGTAQIKVVLDNGVHDTFDIVIAAE